MGPRVSYGDGRVGISGSEVVGVGSQIAPENSRMGRQVSHRGGKVGSGTTWMWEVFEPMHPMEVGSV
jgi:hypothetical protein